MSAQVSRYDKLCVWERDRSRQLCMNVIRCKVMVGDDIADPCWDNL